MQYVITNPDAFWRYPETFNTFMEAFSVQSTSYQDCYIEFHSLEGVEVVWNPAWEEKEMNPEVQVSYIDMVNVKDGSIIVENIKQQFQTR